MEKWTIYSHRNIFPSNQLFSDLFSKCIVFTKFLPKKRESKFPYFPLCIVYKKSVIFWSKIFFKFLVKNFCENTYITAMVDKSGQVSTFGGIHHIILFNSKQVQWTNALKENRKKFREIESAKLLVRKSQMAHFEFRLRKNQFLQKLAKSYMRVQASVFQKSNSRDF